MGVRREKVILELEDKFTSGMARAAAQTALLRRNVEQLNREIERNGRASGTQAESLSRLNRELRSHQNALQGASSGLNGFNRQAQQANQNARSLSNQFDRASGRVRLLVDAIVALGPALVPIGAVGIPAVTGLANQLGIAALAAGSVVIAFQGMGDAIKALNEYDLDPSLDNLAKIREEFAKIGPDAQAMALQISQLRDEWDRLRNNAAAGFFRPIVGELDNADVLLERLQNLLWGFSRAAGLEVATGLDSLGSDRWKDFFDFLAREAQPTMRDLSQIIGNTAHAMGNMWMAFQPMNRDFGDWMVDVTDRLDEWSESLDENASFQEFVDYIYNSGPRVADALGAIGGALVDIVVAAAPLGGPTLQILEAVADVIGTIADSNIGTPLLAAAAAMTVMNRSGMLLTATLGRVTGAQGFATIPAAARQANAGIRGVASNVGILATGWATAGARSQREAARMAQASASLRQTGRNIAAPAAALTGLGLAATGAASGMGITNTVSLGLMGTMAGPWGAAIGAGVGLLMDLSAASDAAAESQRRVEQAAQGLAGTLDPSTGAVTEQTRELLRQIIAAEDMDKTLRNLGYTSEQMIAIVTGQSDGFTEMYGSLLDMGGAGKEAAEMLSLLSEKMADARRDQTSMAEAAGMTTTEYDRAAGAIDRMATAYKNWSDTLTAFDAETAVGAALRSIREAAQETGVSFDEMTESGQKFRGALSEWSSATQALIDTTPVTQQGFVLEQQIERLAETMGISIDTAWQWANEVGVSAETVNASVNGASAQLELLGGKFASLPPVVLTEIATNGIPQTEAQVDALVTKYDLTEGTRTALMAVVTESAELEITNYREMLNALPPEVRTKLIIEDLQGRASADPVDSWFADYAPQRAIEVPVEVEVDTSQIDAADQRATALETALDEMTNPRQVGVGLVGSEGMQADLGNITGRLQGISNPNWTATLSAQDRLSGVVASARAALASINRNVTVRITGVMSGFSNLAGRTFSAEGNLFGPGHPAVTAYATGGMDVPNGHQPEITRPGGPIRIWSEPETQGEAYIPLANDSRRSRAIEIWEQTGRELDVYHFARGGTTAAQKAAERRQAVLGAINSFAPEYRADNMDPRMKALRDDINELRLTMKSAGVGFSVEATRAAGAMQKTAARLFTLQDSVDGLREAQKNLMSQTIGHFRNDLWDNGVAGARLQLEADINDARTAREAQAKLGKLGVNAGLLEGLYASGDIGSMTQLAGMSKAEIAELNKLYATRQSVSSAVGANAAQQVYGAQIAKLDKQIAQQTYALSKYEKAIENAAYRGYVAGAKAVAAGTNARRK